jgi:hypothetical protein
MRSGGEAEDIQTSQTEHKSRKKRKKREFQTKNMERMADVENGQSIRFRVEGQPLGAGAVVEAGAGGTADAAVAVAGLSG